MPYDTVVSSESSGKGGTWGGGMGVCVWCLWLWHLSSQASVTHAEAQEAAGHLPAHGEQ